MIKKTATSLSRAVTRDKLSFFIKDYTNVVIMSIKNSFKLFLGSRWGRGVRTKIHFCIGVSSMDSVGQIARCLRGGVVGRIKGIVYKCHFYVNYELRVTNWEKRMSS